jgi:hypothetical protein
MAEEIYKVRNHPGNANMKTDPKDIILAAFVTAIGLFIRISAPLSVTFPLNDGGLFYKMMLDLQENHFVLPMFTSYNHANIPFAYPPLAFYVYTIISSLSHISLLKLMQFGPAIISSLSIPAFFLLAREILDKKSQVILSTLIFSFVPRAFDWLIMGGGMTRSLGLLFALLAIRQGILLFSSPTAKNRVLMILWSGLVILTHPEAAIHTCIASILIFVWKDFTITGFKRAFFVAVGALAISAPWWIAIFLQHGPSPFAAVLSSAGQDSDNLIVRLLVLFRFDFTDEPYMTLISVLGLIGIFAMLAKQKPALPIWFCLIQIIEPRGGGLYMMIPLSMFAGFALDQVILPVFNNDNITSNTTSGKLNPGNVFIGIIFLYGMLSASFVSNKIVHELTLNEPDLNALAWVKNNTPSDSQFIVITQGIPLNDSTSEWFPALTDRTSVATIFGWEWVNDKSFGARITAYKDLQACSTKDEHCIDQWAQKNNLKFNYVYIKKTNEINGTNILIEKLGASGNYVIRYETSAVAILQKTQVH